MARDEQVAEPHVLEVIQIELVTRPLSIKDWSKFPYGDQIVVVLAEPDPAVPPYLGIANAALQVPYVDVRHSAEDVPYHGFQTEGVGYWV